MKLVFAGTPHNAAATLKALHLNGTEIALVITRPDAAIGRKKVITPSPVSEMADALGLPLLKTNVIDDTALELIAASGAELGVVVAYGAFLKTKALAALDKGWLNVHYSLLPHWRGAAPVQRAILAGDRETGVTVFRLDEGMDTGPVYLRVPSLIEPGENSARLLDRLTTLGISALLEVLPQIEAGLISAQPQDQELAKELPLAAKLSRNDGAIDWNETAVRIERRVLAMNPEPMAWTNLNEETFRILDARALGATDWSALSQQDSQVGTVSISEQVIVNCGGGTLLELKEVQPAGKKAMLATDWARGQISKTSVAFN
ncbi:methionyl-tRNA formyltransferase [Rhodoluna sp.]|uniref:methionyl-tRNA formyltransferase n=1 Tax=Rhodoluna sp. TaxID=1969481 RepID=UPI0025D38022|nr:methionyl-tRNA formyltransferase [Rhodoluna sp.]